MGKKKKSKDKGGVDSSVLKDHITSLNEVTPDDKINPVGQTTEALAIQFKNKVTALNEAGTELPDPIIDFYNDNLEYFGSLPDEASSKGKGKKSGKKKSSGEKKSKSKVERNSAGMIVGSNNEKVFNLLSETPTKMSELKKKLGNTYYTLMGQHPEIFIKAESGHFYVKGSKAEKAVSALVKEIKEKKEAAAAKKKASAEKKAEAAKKKAEKEKSKKDKKSSKSDKKSSKSDKKSSKKSKK